MKTAMLASMIGASVGASGWAAELKMGLASPAYHSGIGYIIKTVVEANFPSTVEMLPGSVNAIYKAMDVGEINIYPVTWLPNNQGVYDEYVARKGTVTCSDAGWTVSQGFMTTAAAQEKYGIRSISDLLRPEVALLTDTGHMGKGEIWVGEPQWQSTAIDKLRAKGYGFADLYELQTYGEAVAEANLSAALSTGDVVILAGDDMMAALFPKGSVGFLSEPKHDPDKWHPVQPTESPDWFDKGYVATSWPVATSYICYNSALRQVDPAVAEFIDRIRIPTDDVKDIVYSISVLKQEPEVVARDWIQKNPDKVKEWLGR